ncbi:MAG: arginine deiminase [Solobacterium sp.]|nr:arginine deiminase [Solobacterium sp.]
MKPINVKSEIAPLKKVLLHRPGKELLNLIPSRLPELLFDDIPFLDEAIKEHDAFVKILQKEGVEIVYLEDLMSEVFEERPDLVKPFLYQWLLEGDIATKKWQDFLYSYLIENYSGKDLVLKTMEGITLREMPSEVRGYSLQDMIAPNDDLIVDPMPNLYFTRDPFASVINGAIISKMRYKIRRRETIYADYIFEYHPFFKGKVNRYYDRKNHASIEGGDVLVLNENTLAIGISERTTPDAIEKVVHNIFLDEESSIHTVLAFMIPATRAFMHLDTVFTQVDYDKYTVHPAILDGLTIFELQLDEKEEVSIKRVDGKLEDILEKYTGIKNIQLIQCGGDDLIASAREQWNDGSNTLCISPGKIIVYSRNVITNELLRKSGLEVLEMPSAELSRGRGGPRCMSMPLVRED